MLRCLLLNYPWDGRNPITYYIQRTGYLSIAAAGALTDELAQSLSTQTYDFVFLHLSAIDEPLPTAFMTALLPHQSRLVVTSPFPRLVHPSLGLDPAAYLTEPYPFDRFLVCMERLIQQTA